MKKTLALFLALAPLTSLSAAGGRDIMSAQERVIEGVRPVAVSVPQDHIATSVEIGRVMLDSYGGGAIGTLITMAMDKKHQTMTENASTRADDIAAPLVAALAGFDMNALSLSATQAAFDAPEWFAAGPVELVSDAEGENTADFAAANPSQQLALVTYRYQLSPDFTQIQVIADIELARSDDLSPIFRQQIASIVRLDRPSYVFEENVERWSADDARIARGALAAAYERLELVIPLVLELDEDGYDNATDRSRESALAGPFHGPLLLRDERGPVIWDKDIGFVAVQVAAN